MDKKKLSRLAGGDPLSFPTLKKNLQKQPDPVKTIMEIAALLRESEEVGNQQWQKLSKRFFTEYRDTIMHYYGYENTVYKLPLRVVNNPRFFIAVIDVLFEFDVFQCKKAELAKSLSAVFDLGIEYSTTRKWLYDKYPEYEEFLTKFKELVGTQKSKK